MLDGVRLKISPGNSKLGPVPNISLPPILTCRDDAPCVKDCYAKQFFIMYPNVRNAWSKNYHLYKEDQLTFWGDLVMFLTLERPRRFRLFVGGDFPDKEFFDKFLDIAITFSDINFLCFTKRYEFVEDAIGCVPPNLKLVLSIWPGLEIPDCACQFPTAWLSNDDRFQAETYIKCGGKCYDCGYQCWSAISPELPVVFDKH